MIDVTFIVQRMIVDKSEQVYDRDGHEVYPINEWFPIDFAAYEDKDKALEVKDYLKREGWTLSKYRVLKRTIEIVVSD